MKKLNIGIFLSLLLMVGLCSCGEQLSLIHISINHLMFTGKIVIGIKIICKNIHTKST